MFILTTYTINQDFSTYILSPNSTGTYNFSFLFVRLQKLEEMTQLELTREMLGVRSESASGIYILYTSVLRIRTTFVRIRIQLRDPELDP